MEKLYQNSKLVWLGIPRTGTTSLQLVLDSTFGKPCGRKHEQIKKFNSDTYYLTFTRNPYSRMLSLYGWFTVIKNNKLSFNDFVNKLKSIDTQKTSTYHWLPQSRYILDVANFNFIGKYETYEEDVYRFLSEFNIKYTKKIPHEYKGGTFSSEYMTTEFIEVVNSKYEDDFIKFNYSML